MKIRNNVSDLIQGIFQTGISPIFYADIGDKRKMDYEISKISGKQYQLKDIVRVIDPKQMKLYVKNEVYPVDMYTTTDIETGEDKLVMLFSKKESQPLYILWKNRELK